MSRFFKQLIIALVYVLIIGGIIFLFYRSDYAPTCSDKVQNGQEEGIDCGTIACGMACPSSIQPIEIQSSELIKTPIGDYDFVAQVYNPNTDHGVVNGAYELNIGGQTSVHSFYMLPGETKYLVLTSLSSSLTASQPQVTIKSVEWERVTGNPVIQFSFSNEKYNVSGGQSAYEANVTNNSDFDLLSIDVVAIVTASDGRVLATNTSSIQSLLSRTGRYLKLSWPFALPSDARINVQATTNVFNNDNFLKRNGTQEKFQQLF